MAAPNEQNGSHTGISSSEFFQSIGHKAVQLETTPNDQAEKDDGDEPKVVEEIESLCMQCHDNGITRLLLTSIPYFREVILMSFSCEHCGFKNNEIQAASSVQLQGSRYELRLTEVDDLSRQVVKADTGVVKFIELDLEIPQGRGQLTNVEGILSGIVDDLEVGQEIRRQEQPEVYAKVADIITKGRAMLAGESFPFRMSLDDPAGNSWIAPDIHDGVGKWSKRDYPRTPEQNEALGLSNTQEEQTSSSAGVIPTGGQGRLDDNDEIIPNEVYSFPASCPGCMHPCTTHMKMVDIPHFKQVVLMSTVCDDCGYRSNDVKTGGEVPEKGEKISLHVTAPEDLARDILKSESCALECPELNLFVNPGTLGGRFTTVEGLLTQVRDDLHKQIFEADASAPDAATSNSGGDSLGTSDRERWSAFFDSLNSAIRGEREFTVVLVDPLAASYVQSLADNPDQPDAKITIKEYKRTDEEEDDLGLKDIKVEGYEGEAEAATAAASAAAKEAAAAEGDAQ